MNDAKDVNDVEFKIPQNTVIKYIRRGDFRKNSGKKSSKDRVPYGALVAVKNPKEISGFSIGFSLCCSKDRFQKKEALKLAIDRAMVEGWNRSNFVELPAYDTSKTKDENPSNALPHDIHKRAAAFVERCVKYYKSM